MKTGFFLLFSTFIFSFISFWHHKDCCCYWWLPAISESIEHTQNVKANRFLFLYFSFFPSLESFYIILFYSLWDVLFSLPSCFYNIFLNHTKTFNIILVLYNILSTEIVDCRRRNWKKKVVAKIFFIFFILYLIVTRQFYWVDIVLDV